MLYKHDGRCQEDSGVEKTIGLSFAKLWQGVLAYNLIAFTPMTFVGVCVCVRVCVCVCMYECVCVSVFIRLNASLVDRTITV